MPYCSQCGVEVDDHQKSCPLCQQPILKPSSANTSQEAPHPIIWRTSPLSQKQKRWAIWVIISTLIGSSALMVLVINFIGQGSITWAFYPLGTLLSIWALASLILFLYHHPFGVIIGHALILLTYLAALELKTAPGQWFLNLALPMMILVAVLSMALGFLIRHLKEKQFNLVGYALLILGLFCLGLDTILSLRRQQAFPSWSLIVFVALLPIIIILLYYHKSLRKKINLKKYFHY